MESLEGKIEKNPVSEENIVEFARILEVAGYEGAEELIREDLIPLAKEKGISLFEAADSYADDREEQDTSWYQLYEALLKIPVEEIQKLKSL